MKKLLTIFSGFNFLCIAMDQPGQEQPISPKTVPVNLLGSINNLPNGHNIIFRQGSVKIVDQNNQEIKIIVLTSRLHKVTGCEHFICFHCENESISFDHNWEQVMHEKLNINNETLQDEYLDI